MGFLINSFEQRVRVNLNQKTYIIIRDDMQEFHVESRSAFMNIIFKNFYETAMASASLYLDRKKTHLCQVLGCDPSIPSEQNNIIQKLLEYTFRQFNQKMFLAKSDKFKSEIYRINKDNLDYLTSDECKESDLYKQDLGLYLKCILEEYASLPYLEREQIFFKEQYDQVRLAIESKSLLKITLKDNLSFRVWPYTLEPDVLSTRLYLTGFSQNILFPSEPKKPASFRIPYCHKIKLLKEKSTITKSELLCLKQAIANRTPQFLLGEESEIIIRFTQNGLQKYHSQLYLRPPFDIDKTHDNIYVFHCTPKQAEYYFFKFGEDAEIISPDNLRRHFRELHEKAIKVYDNHIQ